MTVNINEKKEFTFIDRLTFIDAVVNKTIADGYEYKNLYTALFLASIVYGYEPNADENGEYDINEIWNDLKHFNIDGKEYDLYKMLAFDNGVFLFNCLEEDLFPIPTYIIIEMLETINKRVEQYYNHSKIEHDVSNLINAIVNLVNNYNDKYGDLDIPEIADKIGRYAQMINSKDMKEVASEIASIIHNEVRDSKTE